MNTITIGDARRFSLAGVQHHDLVEQDDLRVTMFCFEAGQLDDMRDLDHSAVYQVLEGEALVRAGDETERLGKGKLLTVPAGTEHRLENAGGGLLVVLAFTPR